MSLTWRATNKELNGAQKVSSCGRYAIVVTWDTVAAMENMVALYFGKDAPGAIAPMQRYPIDDQLRKQKAAQQCRAACDEHALTRPLTPETLSPEPERAGRFRRT